MFHKIKNVSPLPEYKLSVQFAEGVTKIYDVKPLFQKYLPLSRYKTIRILATYMLMLAVTVLFGTTHLICPVMSYGRTG